MAVRRENIFAIAFNKAGLSLEIDGREPDDIIKEFMVMLGPDSVDVEVFETSDYKVGRVGFERKKDDILNRRDVLAKCTELQSQFPVPVLIVQHSLDDVIGKATARGMHRNQIIGMVASLVARGIIPIFAGKRRNLVDLIMAIGVKCNDGKDRTHIEPLRPIASASNYAVRALKGLGLGDKASKQLLKHWGTPTRVHEAIYIFGCLDKHYKRAFGLSGINAMVENALQIMESRIDGG